MKTIEVGDIIEMVCDIARTVAREEIAKNNVPDVVPDVEAYECKIEELRGQLELAKQISDGFSTALIEVENKIDKLKSESNEYVYQGDGTWVRTTRYTYKGIR